MPTALFVRAVQRSLDCRFCLSGCGQKCLSLFPGVALEGEFAEMTPREFTLDLDMSSTVVKPEETALILVFS